MTGVLDVVNSKPASAACPVAVLRGIEDAPPANARGPTGGASAVTRRMAYIPARGAPTWR